MGDLLGRAAWSGWNLYGSARESLATTEVSSTAAAFLSDYPPQGMVGLRPLGGSRIWGR